MNSLTIHSFMLNVLHTFVTLFEIIRDTILHILEWCFRIYTGDTSIEKLSKEVKQLGKVPCHLVIMLGNESPSYKDLANIVLWSIASRIQYITLYDHSGMLKKTKQQLYDALKQINLRNDESDVWQKPLNGNKELTFSSIRLNILSMLDGRDVLTEHTKDSVANPSKIDDIGAHISYVGKKLVDRLNGYPDPDLAFCSGRLCSTYGLLPWQIRLTEFLNIPTHHNMAKTTFLALLQKFGQTEQRYGK